MLPIPRLLASVVLGHGVPAVRQLFWEDDTKLAHGRRCPRHRAQAITSPGLWRKESPDCSQNPLQPPTKERKLRIIFIYHRLGSAIMIVPHPLQKENARENPRVGPVLVSWKDLILRLGWGCNQWTVSKRKRKEVRIPLCGLPNCSYSCLLDSAGYSV